MAIDIKNIKKKQTEGTKKTESSGILNLLNKEITFGKKGMSDKKKERFYGELSVLVNSGIDLASSLQIILDQEKNKKILVIYKGLLDQLIRGENFSQAMQTYRSFTEYEYYNIMIGEESGTLKIALNELAVHYKTRMKQRRQLVSALSYPILVLVVAFAAVTFMLNVIVPMFAGVFQRFGGELPAITRRILKISNFMTDHILIILIVIGLIVGLIVFIKRYDWYKRLSSKLMLKIPVMGNLMLKIYLTRFCSSLHLLANSGAPLIDALELIKKMIRFYPLNVAIEGMIQGISAGKSLNGSMKPFKIFDAQFISLVKVGEETGKLEYILQQLHEQYSEEVEYKTKQLGSLLEPVLILGVGTMVLIIMIAMYLPLFQLSTSII